MILIKATELKRKKQAFNDDFFKEDDGARQERSREEALLDQVPAAAICMRVSNDEDLPRRCYKLYLQGLHCEWVCHPQLHHLQVSMPDWHFHGEGHHPHGHKEALHGRAEGA
jgi:hypothetical protein